MLTPVTPATSLSRYYLLNATLFVQFPVEVEHFYATMASVSGPELTAVMGFETAVMEVMRLGVLPVSRSDTWGGMHTMVPWL